MKRPFRALLVVGMLLWARRGESVAIGVFAPKEGETGVALRRGAQLALDRANREEGSVRFRLVEATADARWGAASRELTRLIDAENAIGIVGAADGRSAHLAEQIVARAKGKSLFVASWASDTTLTRIRIPWFFSVMPDDEAQVAALERTMRPERYQKVVVVAENQYDARRAAQSVAKRLPFRPLLFVTFDSSSAGVGRAVSVCETERPDAVVLLAEPTAAERFVLAFRRSDAKTPIFVTQRLLCETFLSVARSKGVRLPTPFDSTTKAYQEFARLYRARYGGEPPVAAAYAYDAATALVRAFRDAHGDRERLRDAVARVAFLGATGLVRFAPNGSRSVER